MTTPARISIITLGVSDLAVSSAFYEALGWIKAASSTDTIAWFPTADSVLGLYPREELARDANLAAEPVAPFGGVTLAINVEGEDDVDHVIAQAIDAGATLLRAPEHADWGGYRGYFADPDGHPWEVAHNPYVGFRSNGSLDLR